MRHMALKVFPENARLNRVMGILHLLSCNSGRIGIGKLSAASKMHVDMLLPQVTAAKMLGLIRMQGSNIIITPLGEQMRKKDAEAMREIRSKLMSYEPFKSALSLTKGSKRRFTSEELSEILEESKLCWSTKTRENTSIINSILVQWAIHFRLLEYDGKRRTWVES